MLEKLLTPLFIETFFYELEETKKHERDCQRIFTFLMRVSHPHFFTKMISDLPGVSSSLGYDIFIITPEKNIYIEMKIFKKGRIEKSQYNFKNEISGFSFIEHHFLYIDIENKKFIFS